MVTRYLAAFGLVAISLAMRAVLSDYLGAHAMQGRGRIQVRVSTENSTCHIAVSDEGPGIPPDVQERVFIPFFTTKRRGTGLGLPTAKRFIEAHDGRITIQSSSSGGTTVTVQLPLN